MLLFFKEEQLERVYLAMRDGPFAFSTQGASPSIEKQLALWGAGEIPFPFSLDLSSLPPFTQQVLEALQTIPSGETRSYREIAEQIGSPRAARAVGQACGRNPFPFFIPCHRVISTNGAIGGFSLPLPLKESLLLHEQNSLTIR